MRWYFRLLCASWPLSQTSSHFKIYIPGMPRLWATATARPGAQECLARLWGWNAGLVSSHHPTETHVIIIIPGDIIIMGKFSLARLVMCAKYQRLTSEDYVRLGLCLPDNCQDCVQGHGHYVKNDKMVSQDPSSENHCQKVPKYFDDSVKMVKSS